MSRKYNSWKQKRNRQNRPPLLLRQKQSLRRRTKHLHKKVIQALSWIILMLALTGCVSHPKEDKKETPAPVVKIETIYFPSFPQPPEDIIPLDKDKNIVTSDDTEVIYMQLPYWYWNLIIDYVEETEQAVTSLTARHPP